MPINPIPVQKKQKEKNSAVFLVSEPSYQFSDMVIEPQLKGFIMDAISIFQYKEKVFEEWKLGKVIKKPMNFCINFYGEPGTGKTMAANAVASELGMKVLKVNYADIESKYVGETSKNLVSLFQYAKQEKVLILFDEADALLSRRVTDMSSSADVSVNQTRSVLLTLLDSFEGMVIFTTNFIQNYDSAFMRRIPYHIRFDLPNEAVRYQLLNHYLMDTIPNRISIAEVAKKYNGISGSDIANATLAAALRTARAKKEYLEQAEFEQEIERILLSKRANKGNTEKEKEVITETETREVTEAYAKEQLGRTGGILL